MAEADFPVVAAVVAAAGDGEFERDIFFMTSSVRLLLAFSLALFVSASLLFSVQPMISKMVLPILGGSPAVWITAMVFFQGALLAGYGYAYTVIRFMPLKAQVITHLTFLTLALFILPMSISESWGTPDWQTPQIWLLTVFMGVVAFPFVVASGSTTLLQSWFSHSKHRHASDPYFLYAASNAGSLLALLAYPTILEPVLTLSQQTKGWAIFYCFLIALIAFCGIVILRTSNVRLSAGFADPTVSRRPPSIPWSIKIQWIGLAFAPSMLLLGTTLFIQTDIASIPFFWVAPLAIYLLTFIIAFAKRQFLSRKMALTLQAISLILVTLFFWRFDLDTRLMIGLHLVNLFFAGLVCHGTLAALRPSTDNLAEFYLWISVGGWIGGLLGGIFSPMVFDSVVEYPLAILIVSLFRGLPFQEKEIHFSVPWIAALTLVAYWCLNPWFGANLTAGLSSQFVWAIYAGSIGAGMFLVRDKPWSLAILTGVLLFTANPIYYASGSAKTIYQDRSFFGVSKVRRATRRSGELVHILISGNTIHGAQLRSPALQTRTMTYHFLTGPIGQLFTGLRNSRGIRQVGVAGLGAGTTACLLKGDERMTFFEIDPTVIEIATTPEFFSYIELCGKNSDIQLGDARILIQSVPDESLDLLLLDAFSSDAVPVHLMTDEALRLYFRKVTPGGVVAFNVSSRYFDLQPVLSRLAQELGLVGLRQNFVPSGQEARDGAFDTTLVVLARSEEDLDFLIGTGGWLFLTGVKPGDHWTDNFSNVLGALMIR